MKTSKKNILIEGTGVIGAYLSKFLLSKNYNIYVTTKKKKRFDNYKKLNIKNKVNFIKLDILNIKSIYKLIKKINPLTIYYLAGQSSIKKSFSLKKSTMDSNFLGCKNFVKVLYKNDLKINLLKANSGYIFSSINLKNPSNNKLIKVNSPYVNAQQKAFRMIQEYRNKGINCSNIILFNAESHLRPNDYFIKKVCIYIKKNIYKKQKLKLGNIKIIRDFGWVPDLVKAIYYMTYLKPCDLIIGSGKKISLEKILQIIFKIKNLNYKKYIEFDKKLFRKNEKEKIFCDIEYTKKILKKWKWKPKIYKKKLMHKIYNYV